MGVDIVVVGMEISRGGAMALGYCEGVMAVWRWVGASEGVYMGFVALSGVVVLLSLVLYGVYM